MVGITSLSKKLHLPVLLRCIDFDLLCFVDDQFVRFEVRASLRDQIYTIWNIVFFEAITQHIPYLTHTMCQIRKPSIFEDVPGSRKIWPPLATWCLRFFEFFQFSCSNALTWLPIVVYESARMFAKYSMLIPGIFCTPRCTRGTFYGNLGLEMGRLRGRPRLQFAWGECTGRWNITHRCYPSE